MHLEITNVTKTFPGKGGKPFTALQEVDMHIETGEFICVVGASGSGKSTLLRLVAGLEMPTSGQITVDGEEVVGPGPDRGMVFQSYTLYPWMTVADNVAFGLKLQGVDKADRQGAVGEYLDVVGLSKFSQAYPKELSGGMKQRVAIARALACQPKILLMDEPFGALDVQTKETMQQFLLRLWKRTQTSIMMITHDVEEAIMLSQRIYVLSAQPGTVKAELPIHFDAERSHKLKRLSTFQDLREEISSLIRSPEAELTVS